MFFFFVWTDLFISLEKIIPSKKYSSDILTKII